MAALAHSDPPPSLESRTVAELARLARAAGVRVSDTELRSAVSGLSAAELARLPESYARDLADAAATGLDLNDPKLEAPIFSGTADEVIRAVERGETCAPST